MLLHLLTPGRIAYADGLALQQRILAERKAGTRGDTLILCEHPPVLTLGRNATRANVLLTDDELAAKGAALHVVNRGGDVTYHGPGQLVGYPIFDLRSPELAALRPGRPGPRRGPHLGPVDFVRLLEEALIQTCGHFAVPAQRIAGRTGVWTFASGEREERKERKLAAIGIHVSAGITSHGFALNVSTDLRDFAWIVPCGIADRGVTSLELEAPEPPTLAETLNVTARTFARIFNAQVLAE